MWPICYGLYSLKELDFMYNTVAKYKAKVCQIDIKNKQ